ncbi:hypothetical protein C475_02271 [Halosimplex carlsbadense 2-9-1]|uniref:Uncharacterized protein n=1 Tax=Halosimplex carlsbadense 2-9-1 TaxID=797114 RepID=M0D2Q5_9EURY|nr:hypothetical protein [Halosimplex carlsbadense]ELZ29735.1 hypothetical protein C475_02271 [Halosimplex carlsbadense 2-9-1]
MDDTASAADIAALRTTIRRCTAVLVALLASAFGPLSNYQYDGTLFLAGAVIYLVVSALGRFPGEDPIVEINPDAAEEGADAPTGSDPGANGTDPDEPGT